MANASARKRRTNGEASRARIVEAAARIAGERGYDGTSINLVSEHSGLPASSIYWHFKDKDELIAAVIDRSFEQWIEAFDRPPDLPLSATPDDGVRTLFERNGRALEKFPHFLRLGLMLVLDCRQPEPTARAKFVEVRRATAARLTTYFGEMFTELDGDGVQRLVVLTLALADGFFIANQVEQVDLESSFAFIAEVVLNAVHGGMPQPRNT